MRQSAQGFVSRWKGRVMKSKVIGLERLKRRLSRIPEAVKKRAQADLMLAGREVNMLQRALCPVDSGRLRETIRTEALEDGTIGVEIKAGGPLTTKAVRKSEKGNAGDYDYALGVELGTSDTAPEPFFWPGYKAKKRAVRKRVRAGVRRALKQATGAK